MCWGQKLVVYYTGHELVDWKNTEGTVGELQASGRCLGKTFAFGREGKFLRLHKGRPQLVFPINTANLCPMNKADIVEILKASLSPELKGDNL